MGDSPRHHYIFVFSADKDVLIDKTTNYFPATSVSCQADSYEDLSWRTISEDFAKKLFIVQGVDSDNEEWTRDISRGCKLVRLLRLWYPFPSSASNEAVYLQRHIFWRKLTVEERDKLTLHSPDVIWMNVDGLLEAGTDPETTDILSKLRKPPSGDLGFKAQEFSEDSFILDTSGGLESNPSPVNCQHNLMAAAKFGRDEQILIYRDFVSRCLPQLFMSLTQFESMMLEQGWDHLDMPDLFRCFKQSSNGCPNLLSYNEVISGLAICQPLTPHGDFAGEMRCRYIFKYYDKDNDNKLSFDEFCLMVRDIRAGRKLSTSPEDVKAEASITSSVFGSESEDTLSLSDFLIGVGQLKFRGTSSLLRSSISVIDFLTQKRNKELDASSSKEVLPASKKRRIVAETETTNGELKRENSRHRNTSAASDTGLPPFLFSFDEEDDEVSNGGATSGSGVAKEFEFATHVIKVRRSGQVSEVKSLWELEGSAVSASVEFPPSMRFQFGRMSSICAFNVASEANEMLKGLRYFEKTNKTDPGKRAMSWGIVDMTTVATSLISICRQVKSLMMQEPRLLKIKTPVYVLGDIHGNFRDLICFEKSLWRMGTNITPSNFLFLGDYVDRGEFGVEVVAYLFSQKLIAPTKFHLLRGNHEDRSIQKNFTFYKECLVKFGQELGKRVWEEINQAFDVMPIAAVVDDKVFCVHGGIPPPEMGRTIQALNQVAVDLPHPESQEPLVWEYLWNDPLPADPTSIPSWVSFEIDEDDSTGFVKNFRRGTGHMFSDRALNDFLARNNLSLVIRAHEVKQTGFQVQQNQKLLTVFSSSKYCNGSNEAACVLIDNKKLRVIRLDTS